MTAGPGGAGQGGRVQGQQSSRLSERATHVTAVVVTDEVEQVAALAGGGARPPAWALAARTGQTQDQASSRRAVDVTRKPPAPFAATLGQVAAAIRDIYQRDGC